VGDPLNVTELALDPADPRRLYLGVGRMRGHGSANGLYVCENVRAADPEFRRLGAEQLGAITSLCICRDHPQTMYALAFDPAMEEVRSVWSAPRIWRSDDRGESWRELSTGLGNIPRGVLVSPLNADWVYLQTNATVTNDVPVGLYRSADGGGTWQAICPDHTTARTRADCLSMDPADPRRLLVYDFGSTFEVWDLQAPH